MKLAMLVFTVEVPRCLCNENIFYKTELMRAQQKSANKNQNKKLVRCLFNLKYTNMSSVFSWTVSISTHASWMLICFFLRNETKKPQVIQVEPLWKSGEPLIPTQRGKTEVTSQHNKKCIHSLKLTANAPEKLMVGRFMVIFGFRPICRRP